MLEMAPTNAVIVSEPVFAVPVRLPVAPPAVLSFVAVSNVPLDERLVNPVGGVHVPTLPEKFVTAQNSSEAAGVDASETGGLVSEAVLLSAVAKFVPQGSALVTAPVVGARSPPGTSSRSMTRSRCLSRRRPCAST